jgi:hypothetical protein
MNQPNAIAMTSSQAGMPHSSTLRNPGWLTARISTTDRKTQTIFASLMGEKST